MSTNQNWNLSEEQKVRYRKDGFLVLKSPVMREIKEALHQQLKMVSLGLIERIHSAAAAKELQNKSFQEIFDWAIANETDHNISRPFYELFPATPEIIRLVGNPVLFSLAKELDIKYPISSCLPILRIDRPKDMRWNTPVHQDYWYSLLSPNSVTYWFPILPVTKDMGDLGVIPGTHAAGVLPVKVWSDDNPFTTKADYKDEDFIPVNLADDEVLVFNQCLVHKSGKNNSNKARLTLQMRYNDLYTLGVPTSSFTTTHSRYVKEAQRKLLEASQA